MGDNYCIKKVFVKNVFEFWSVKVWISFCWIFEGGNINIEIY